MDLKDKVIVVTGGASGIGRGLCHRFAKEAPRGIVVADLDEAGAVEVATEIGGTAACVHVGRESDIQGLVELTEKTYGPIDLFCSNAGIFLPGGPNATDEEWRRILDVNFMAHVWAARHVLPSMVERKSGYILATASAAGLLSQIGSAPYAVTKHAAVAFAEWISIHYGDSGIGVSCLCPQGVRTKMLTGDGAPSFLLHGALEPDTVADACVEAIREERFLVLPHPEVLEYFRRKASDYDRWIRGMRRLMKGFA